MVLLVLGWLLDHWSSGPSWIDLPAFVAPPLNGANLSGIGQPVTFRTLLALHDCWGTRQHWRDLLAIGPHTGTERIARRQGHVLRQRPTVWTGNDLIWTWDHR
jgi:hypothetical protein